MAETAWQPIDTAPKDGTFVLVWLGRGWDEAEVLRWDRLEDGWVDRHDSALIGSDLPTHWLPLPAAPIPHTPA